MNKKLKWTIYGFISVIVLVLIVAGVRVYQLEQNLAKAQKPKEESRFAKFEEKAEYVPPEWTGTERVNILLMGGDERGLTTNEVARSDSMIVASIDPTAKTIHVMSVLRDTWVEIPGYRDNRANTALSLGGPNLAMKTIGNMLGLDIQYYMYVDFQGFIKLVDAIGGIDFYVEKNMHYTDAADGHKYDIDLKEGQQHLDGTKALQYVRFRHDKLSDFTRTGRQRDFLKAIADKMQTVWNLYRLPDIIDEVVPYLETNMSTGDMLKLGTLGYKSHQAGSAQMPPNELLADKTINGSSVLAIRDKAALKVFVQQTLAKDTSKVTETGGDKTSDTK
ncbi:MAG: LCP family protein [Candidatus Cohnella colombiensis]|uniref:LCP family protein n=1 Tax=Candidatus Cohnella colombiensis TaxID=3121368 RepID=A0AA95EYF3_9BACL|nr:MAG: LCP family protein [Cohnella sp.]